MTMESRIKPLPAPLRAGLLTPVCALCPCLGGPLAAWAWPGLPEPRWAEPHQKTPQGYASPPASPTVSAASAVPCTEGTSC